LPQNWRLKTKLKVKTLDYPQRRLLLQWNNKKAERKLGFST
jgi:hypothetical protein